MAATRVALVHGQGRYGNVAQALQLTSPHVDLSTKRSLLIKPNFVVTDRPLAATHADALRAVLDFVRARYDGAITIAEGPSTELAADGFRCLGYEDLAQTYGATLLDLNHDEAVPVEVYDWRMRPLRLQLARSVVESDFRISVGLPKTHDVVIATLSLKNMIMGSLISRFTHGSRGENGRDHGLGPMKKVVWRLVPPWVRGLAPVEWLQFRAMSGFEPSDKMKMHQSHAVINLNLALVAPRVRPDLSVVDAFEAMEGAGPTDGTAVPLHLAVVSTDPLAADVVGAALMGIDADDVGYLHYCKRFGLGVGDLNQIEIVGNATVQGSARKFQLHPTIHRQRRWKSPQVEALLP